jgi:hypothetical protein
MASKRRGIYRQQRSQQRMLARTDSSVFAASKTDEELTIMLLSKRYIRATCQRSADQNSLPDIANTGSRKKCASN